jgi:hypothetical protein
MMNSRDKRANSLSRVSTLDAHVDSVDGLDSDPFESGRNDWWGVTE